MENYHEKHTTPEKHKLRETAKQDIESVEMTSFQKVLSHQDEVGCPSSIVSHISNQFLRGLKLEAFLLLAAAKKLYLISKYIKV